MKTILLLSSFLLLAGTPAQAQMNLTWWNPVQHAFHVIEGQAWPNEVAAPYDRLPARAETSVARSVWGLSRQSAGLMIRFRANSQTIAIRYGTKWDPKRQGPQQSFGMNHMPATGVSGLDLYALDSDGKEIWCAAQRSFSDTIVYRYQGLRPNDNYHDRGREYRLYLPLYNQVEWLEIGVDKEAYFEALPVRKEKPIVVYGTSIAQGACASRPGMAWTAIVARKMDRPLINLGFSGSGRLEAPILSLMGEIEAKVYVLDCMPNLPGHAWERVGIKNQQQLSERVMAAVRQLKAQQPKIPILLVDHAGYTEAGIIESRKQSYRVANQAQQAAFNQLLQEGYTGLYYLSHGEIGLQADDMVDGTHPTDLGMAHYAASYEAKLRAILQEPIGEASTTRPCIQYREPHHYDWEKRHREILEMRTTDPPKTVFLANSIIHFWGGLPRSKLVREEGSWQDFLTPLGVRNFAYGWDRIENVLWRVYHGELDCFEAERILVMIGTNNLHLNSDAEIIAGLRLLIQAIKVRQPTAECVLMGILPRRKQESRVAALNQQIARLASALQVHYADLGPVFLQEDLQIDEALFSDGLHPNAAGYLNLKIALEPLLVE